MTGDIVIEPKRISPVTIKVYGGKYLVESENHFLCSFDTKEEALAYGKGYITGKHHAA